ncbi:KGG domain-containing protein [Lysobacter sp. Root494]|uniref:KGG domain-containing protein n=1 Tax=Lysobacter sp. Root494 TaxID=1736549 RepID=UPI0009E747DA|nr:KGG domain-containing protein [Lysobacter sp. Root494]
MPNRNESTHRSGRGFASMDAERQRAIASAGGRAAHRSGNAHEFNAEEAREAGRRGGLARSASRQASRTVQLADGQGVMQMQSVDSQPLGTQAMDARDVDAADNGATTQREWHH